jgi:hypothetical protein
MNLKTRFEYLHPGSVPYYRDCGKEIAIFLDSGPETGTGPNKNVLTNKNDFIIFPVLEFYGPTCKSLGYNFIDKIGILVDNIPWEGDEFVLFIPHRSVMWASNGKSSSFFYIYASPAIIRPDKSELFDFHEKSIKNFPIPEEFNYYNLQDEFMIWDILT